MDMDLTRDQGYISYFNSFNNWIASSKPKLLLIFTILIVLFYLVMSGSSSPNTSISNLSPSVNQIGNLMSNTPNAPSANMSPSNGMLSLVEVFLWAIFLILILVNGMQYFFNMDIRTVIKNIFTRHPEIDIVVDHEKQDKIPVPEITYEKQVFHIPDNKYTYNDARAVCKAYGSRLASYKEVEDAYNRGAEWCGYGWSKDQLVLYPTQESTYKKLQKKPGYILIPPKYNFMKFNILYQLYFILRVLRFFLFVPLDFLLIFFPCLRVFLLCLIPVEKEANPTNLS
jgi:hypothetical protein